MFMFNPDFEVQTKTEVSEGMKTIKMGFFDKKMVRIIKTCYKTYKYLISLQYSWNTIFLQIYLKTLFKNMFKFLYQFHKIDINTWSI